MNTFKKLLALPRVYLGTGFVFCLVGLYQIDGPYTDAFHERQNQVAEVSRNIYQAGLRSSWQPRARFGNPDNPGLGYTVLRLEYPFHGISSGLLYHVFGESPWVGRAVSIVLSLLAFWFALRVYAALAGDRAATIGLVLFALAPLTLHCGQVPMPDIVCTLGMIGSMALAISDRACGDRPRAVVASALLFMVALLGKPSIAPYALPIFVSLISFDHGIGWNLKRLSLWLAIAFALPIVWASLSVFDPVGTLTSLKMAGDPTHKRNIKDLMSIYFYIRIVSYIVFFGVGPLGVLLAALGVRSALRDGRVLLTGAVGFSVAFVYCTIARLMWREPQYTLPVLFWIGLYASLGARSLLSGEAGWLRRPLLLVPLIVLQVGGMILATLDLKADRYPHYGELVAIQRVLPPGAKVVQISDSYGATPTYALSRTTIQFGGAAPRISFSPAQSVGGPTSTQDPLPELRSLHCLGYDYLIFIDYTFRGRLFGNDRRWVQGRTLQPDLHRLAEQHFDKIFESPHATLYKLPASF
jgi:hypothetical protein